MAITFMMSRGLIAVMTAQLHAQAGEMWLAMSAAAAMTDTPWSRTLRADLASQARDFAQVLTLTDNLSNTDDLATLALALRGEALRETGLLTAAETTLKEALRYPSRDALARRRARYERAKTFVAFGQKSKAKAEFEKVIAEDSTYLDVRERLAELA